MRKLFQLATPFVIALSMAACGSKSNSPAQGPTPGSNNKPSASESKPKSAPAPAPKTSATSVIDGTWQTVASQVDGYIRKVTVKNDVMTYEVISTTDDADYSKEFFYISVKADSSDANKYYTYRVDYIDEEFNEFSELLHVDADSIVFSPDGQSMRRYHKQ